MKLAVCDDEKEIRRYITDVAKKSFSEISVTEYENADGIISLEFDADILFLDIQMPGTDGMEAARTIRKNGKRTVIIFVTAIEDYVFNAFDVGAAGYIVKPFDEEKIVGAIRKAIPLVDDMHRLVKLGSETDKENRRVITVKSDGINTKVVLEDVLYAEVLNRKITLHLSDGKDISYYGKMTELEGMLGRDFMRIHRAYIVNMKFVKAYDWQGVNVGGKDLPVARGKYQKLVKTYMSYHTRLEGM